MLKVIYHANCSDGFCAAWLMHKRYPDAEYIPMNYGVKLDLTKFENEDIIYFLDFSLKRPVMLELAEIVHKIIVLDHHKSAEAELIDLPENIEVTFDMEKSGAMITYDYFNIDDLEVLELVSYVQDRDLWKFELPNSKNISAYIQAVEFTFETYDYLCYQAPLAEKALMGSAILLKIRQQVALAVKHATYFKLGNYKIKAVNSTVNFSEVAGELAEGELFGVAWFYRSDGKYQYSLRSSEKGMDVSLIAGTYGGGGHKHAAGFESDTLILKRTIDFTNWTGKVLAYKDGYIKIFGRDSGGNRFTSKAPNEPHLIVQESDSEGNVVDPNRFYITESEMETILDGS